MTIDNRNENKQIHNVVVNTQLHDYKVIIGQGILDNIVSEIKSNSPNANKILIVTDTNVASLYLDRVKQILNSGNSSANYEVSSVEIIQGEDSKSIAMYGEILEKAAEFKLTRSDIIVTLGGGVVGDLAGFTAGTYLRGIDYYQVPTTLLACVDSSVGGKTGINLSQGKNLAGLFWQPRAVICDTEMLKTLEYNILLDGISEMIKYGMICDENLFLNIQPNEVNKHIKRCVEIKASIVAEDEKDNGIRQLLNFGHTIGHAIEKLSDYAVSHGKAVAMGMVMITEASVANKICDKSVLVKLIEKLKTFDFQIDVSYSIEEISQIIMSDKKRSGDIINLIVPKSIGNCVIHPVKVAELKRFLEGGTSL